MASGRRAEEDEFIPWPLYSRAQIEESPSFKAGMSFKHERKLREAACKVIGEAGQQLLAYLDINVQPVRQRCIPEALARSTTFFRDSRLGSLLFATCFIFLLSEPASPCRQADM